MNLMKTPMFIFVTSIKRVRLLNNKAVAGTICFLLVMLLFYNTKAHQAFTYTQFANNLIPVNTAYSLVQPGGSANLLMRKQWVGIKGSPSTLIAMLICL